MEITISEKSINNILMAVEGIEKMSYETSKQLAILTRQIGPDKPYEPELKKVHPDVVLSETGEILFGLDKIGFYQVKMEKQLKYLISELDKQGY